MYDPAKNIPLLTSLIAKGVVSCACGDGLTLATAGIQIAKAFAPDVTEHFISVLDYKRVKEFLVKAHPGDLNHDLDKLIKDSLIRAVGFMGFFFQRDTVGEFNSWPKSVLLGTS